MGIVRHKKRAIFGISLIVMLSPFLYSAGRKSQNTYAPIEGVFLFDMGEEEGGRILLKFHFLEGHLWGASPDGDEFQFAPVEGKPFAFLGKDEFLGTVKATFLKDDQGGYNICHLVIEGLGIDVKGARIEPGTEIAEESSSEAIVEEKPLPENASGTFTFNGSSVTIRYGFAWYESSRLNDAVTNLFLMFSDDPVPEDSRGSFDLRDLSRAGKIHGVMVAIALGGTFKHSIVSGSVYHEAIEEPSLSFSGGSLEVDIRRLDDDVIEGRLYTAREMKLFDYAMEVDVAFRVELPEKK